jgi:glycosyltransferase involved in cell wall biosynthesis
MTSIWYVSKYAAPPNCGTTGARGYYLMNEIALKGYKVAVIGSDSNRLISPPNLVDNYMLEKLDNLQFCWVKTAKYSIAKSTRRIFSWVHFEWRLLWLPKKMLFAPDVIVISSLSLLTIIVGLWWRLVYNCSLVFEVRDIWPLTIVEEGGFKSWNPFVYFMSLIERIGYKYADVIVGTMPNLSEHVQIVLGYHKKTYCIPMGVDPSMVNIQEALPESYKNEYIPNNKFIVAYVGTVGITNALETFLECAKRMEIETRIQFLVVGDGDLRDKYIADYGCLSNLKFAPRVKKQMVQSVLGECDLLYLAVHTSKVWRYGQSLNKVIDYMLSGKPIVASYSGYKSMVNEAESGTFIPTGDVDALRREIERYFGMTADERNEIGARGKSWLLANRQYKTLAAEYLDIMVGSARTT